MAFVVGSSTIGQINAGQLLPLATTGVKRSKLLPNVPTMSEAGISGFGFNLWLGLVAPAGTPAPVVAKLADVAHEALHATDTIEALRKQGYETLDVGPDEFATRIREDVTRWTAVVRAAGLKT
jgi:tripartite-type tricarboxylate transporter receptor subunit TctC